MPVHFESCVTEDDFAGAGLFMIRHIKEVHPSFSTLDTATLLYEYVTEGRMIKAVTEEGRIIAIGAYFQGTREKSFMDKEVLFVDLTVMDREYRGTTVFFHGLKYMIQQMQQQYPEAQEVRLAALEENRYLCSMYSKFTSERYKRESSLGTEIVFCEKITKIESFFRRFHRI